MGGPENVELEIASREALRLATINPKLAQASAARAQAAATAAKEPAALSIAAHAAGVAAHQLGDVTGAVDHYRASIRAGRAAGSRILVAQARASLAGSLCVRGWPGKALKQIDLAIDDLDGVAAARAMTQRSAMLQLLGRADAALSDLRQAIPQLMRAGDADWATGALSNRSVLHISRRSFAAAEADLLVAKKLSNENGLHLWAAYVEQNLGALHSSKGEIVAALRHLESAEQQFRGLGKETGSLFVDRGQLLLFARLLDEARAAADGAVRVHRSDQDRLETPNALLLLSTVALVQGDITVAQESAEQAARAFRRLGNRGGVALARYARLQTRYASEPQSVSASDARRCADELSRVGWTVPALEARVLAGLIGLERGHVDEARNDLRLASRVRFTGPADVRVRGWLAEAMLRYAEGRRRSAGIAVNAGFRILDNNQAALGAAELRAHITMHRGSLSKLGLRMALEVGNARRVLTFVERGRASALLFPTPRPPDDPVLSRTLADLRITMKEIDECRQAGRSAASLVQHQVRLERIIERKSREMAAQPGSPRRLSTGAVELAIALKDSALIEYIELDDRLHAVTLVSGRASLHHLGPAGPVRECLPLLPFALRRLANPRSTARTKSAATAVLNRIQRTLNAVLFAPIAGHIGDRPVVVVPSVSLQGIPWPVIPACAGRSISVVPSATLWLGAASRLAPPAGKVVVAAGPGLPGARDEALAIAEIYRDPVLLLDDEASAAALATAADGATVVHIAAHGRLRSDNPYFSSLLMADGPLTVYDLERIQHAPHHVVLAACETARHKTITVDEVLGLAAALLAQGASSLVAPVFNVGDDVVVPIMRAYHGELRSGRSPADALAASQEKAAAQDSAAWAAAVSFQSIGASGRRIYEDGSPSHTSGIDSHI